MCHGTRVRFPPPPLFGFVCRPLENCQVARFSRGFLHFRRLPRSPTLQERPTTLPTSTRIAALIGSGSVGHRSRIRAKSGLVGDSRAKPWAKSSGFTDASFWHASTLRSCVAWLL